MAGHSHWAGIKHQKDVTDKKRGVLFSKLLAAITAASRTEQNPDFNPRLRTAIEKAKANKVPLENIERAIRRASEPGAEEKLLFEAYGPGGTALLIEATTDNRNRTVAEVKKILSDFGAKWADPGSVRWAFEEDPLGGWRAKFPLVPAEEDSKTLAELVRALSDHSDVQSVFANVPL